MKVHAVAHAAELQGMDLTSWTTVIIDAIRASSTIAQAVASGCSRVIPVATVEEALKMKARAGEHGVLLCGEREGLRINGFDLGNSPREYLPEVVGGKTLVFTTTNGTRAMVASRGARDIAIGSFLNLNALVKHLAADGGDVLLVPVGREDIPVLDDVVCAGLYVDRLLDAGGSGPNGAAYLARMMYEGYSTRLLDAVRQSPSGQNLLRIGLEKDLPYCVQVGLLNVVPRVVQGQITGAAI